MYQLKKGQEAFVVVDGPMEGKQFRPGVPYPEIPPQEKSRFEKIKEQAKPAQPRGKDKKTTGKEADK